MHRIALVVAVLAAAAAARGAEPQFWKVDSAKEILAGDLDGVSVDSDGHLRLSRASTLLDDTQAPYVWSVARAKDGTVYAGTGNDGKIFRIKDGKAELFYDASELEVHALTLGPDGRLYAGTSPDGKVYAIDSKGSAKEFYDPPDKYIWALAFDRKGRLLVATGLEGKLYRVDKDGKASAILSTNESHLTSLALGPDDTVYAGSSPEGIVYRVDPADKVFVLLDSDYHEIKGLSLGGDGSLYVAAVDGEKETPKAAPVIAAPAPAPVPVSPGGAEVTVTASLPTQAAPPAAAPGPPHPPSPSGAPKGALFRILSTGEVETLWTSREETPHSLAAFAGGALVGTGDKGKLYRVANDATWTMLGVLPAEQVTALVEGKGGAVLVATANPGKVLRLEATPAARGTFTSQPKDAGTVSIWGRIRWESTSAAGSSVAIRTRSGNTATPDSTWSDWSQPYAETDGTPVTSPRARFLQLKVTLTGASGGSPELRSVSTAYLQRNLRPRIESITIYPPGVVFQRPANVTGQIQILGLDAAEKKPQAIPGFPGPAAQRMRLPSPVTYSRRLFQRGLQTFAWKATDPNDDDLVYDVEYRAEGENRFRPLRTGLTNAVLAWDTSSVPNGRYVIRVRASDAPDNPGSLAESTERESASFEVDNTPPVVTVTLESPRPVKVRAVVEDDASLVKKAEYAVDGGPWEEVYPEDGINDSRKETYAITPPAFAGPGPHVVVVRATDSLGNVATAGVEVP